MKYIIRELSKNDLNKGFFETLRHLAPHNLNEDIIKAKRVFDKIPSNQKMFVAVSKDNEVVGLVTLMIEQRFTRNFSTCGYLSDLVVREGYEDEGIGSLLVKEVTKVAKRMNCYRVFLGCSKNLMEFYERLGYKEYNRQMSKWFYD